jgi:uncharacterized protein
VRAPLVDAGFDKRSVRDVSAFLELSTADKPAQPCLASRVAYGDRVTPEVLARIESAESALRALGIAVVRVRAHAGATVARIEVEPDDLGTVIAHRVEIDGIVRSCGFTYCAVDLAGFGSGRLNELLPIRATS